MQGSSAFSPDYSAARARFREAASALHWELQSYPVGAVDAGGQVLTIDVAISQAPAHAPALMVTSGIHGVEGFFGSAVQLNLLHQSSLQKKAQPIRYVFVHALNPYGFAWRRRGNENNVDLNRNMLLDGEAFVGRPKGYDALNNLLNPPSDASPWDMVTLRILMAVARHGISAIKDAVASGQYDYPKGLFFGGSEPSATSHILRQNLNQWLGDSDDVLHLDFHSGLGSWATYKLLIDYQPTDSQLAWLKRCFDPSVLQMTATGGGVAYPVRGSLGRWCVAHNLSRNYKYVAAEFGTSTSLKVLLGLRLENQVHHWGRPESATTERAKKNLVELFCPRSETWRQRVLEQSSQLFARGNEGLLQEINARQ